MFPDKFAADISVEALYEKATEVFGDATAADVWFKSPCAEIGGDRPEDLFNNSANRHLAMELLLRAEQRMQDDLSPSP